MSKEQQKIEMVDKLWQAGNIATGYGVVQAVAIVIALSNTQQRDLLLSVWYILAPAFIAIGALLVGLVHRIGCHELRLRMELGADESLVDTVRKAAMARALITILVHVALAVIVIILGNSAHGGA